MFKKPAYHHLPKEHQPATYADYQPPCPECHAPMINMGKEFRPPRKQDVRGRMVNETEQDDHRRFHAALSENLEPVREHQTDE